MSSGWARAAPPSRSSRTIRRSWPRSPGVEHHLGPAPRPDAKRFPSSARTRSPRSAPTARSNWSPTTAGVGRQAGDGRIAVWPRGSTCGTDQRRHVQRRRHRDGVVGTLTTPDGYTRTDYPSAGSSSSSSPRGPRGAAGAPGAVALCTPRDVIARNAEVPVSDARLNPAADNSFARPRWWPRPAAPCPTRRGAPRWPGAASVRIGYQTRTRGWPPPSARSPKAARRHHGVRCRLRTPSVRRRCGISIIDVLLASTGGATGSGSTGSSALDAYSLFTGNGNNLPNYGNGQIDGIISAPAVTVDPCRRPGVAASAPVLWADVPTRCRSTVNSAPC